jgi:hypothetical protein
MSKVRLVFKGNILPSILYKTNRFKVKNQMIMPNGTELTFQKTNKQISIRFIPLKRAAWHT